MSMEYRNKKGCLERWVEERGYGFIRHDDRLVFVHRTSYLFGFKPELGRAVAFDFGLAPNGRPPMAINVRVVKAARAVAAEKQVQRGLEALLKGEGGTAA
jgi:cold shock CspA family protein